MQLLKTLLVIFLWLTALDLPAQDSNYTKPAMTSDPDHFRRQYEQDSTKKMIELKSMIPRLVYDLRYATTNNFMHRLMYPAGTNQTFLRLPAAKALLQVQSELALQGKGLKIFDAYRPWSVTAKFWELVKDERYVANPSRGSGHNRGVAVDLTVIWLKDGTELNMGTGFDNFSDSAHQGFTRLPDDILQNRKLLKSLMEKNGFKALDTEWWHYSLPESGRFEILDIPFKKLKKNL